MWQSENELIKSFSVHAFDDTLLSCVKSSKDYFKSSFKALLQGEFETAVNFDIQDFDFEMVHGESKTVEILDKDNNTQ